MRASHVQVTTDGEVSVMRLRLHRRSRPQTLRIFAAPTLATLGG